MEFEKAKQILNCEKEENYTDDEIKQILEFLSVLAKVSIDNLLKRKNDE